jgi:hypothetical protein
MYLHSIGDAKSIFEGTPINNDASTPIADQTGAKITLQSFKK